MLALKFLLANGTGLNGFEWPQPRKAGDGTWTPGDWVGVEGDVVPCKNGIHACLPDQAKAWKSDRLFVIELDGVIDSPGHRDKLIARRGRLLREVEQWARRRQVIGEKRRGYDQRRLDEVHDAVAHPERVEWREAVEWLAWLKVRPPALVCSTAMLCRAIEPVVQELAGPAIDFDAILGEVA
jgi:hypothetical protein